MSSHSSFPAELFPGIIQHASATDLKAYSLVNSFFRSLAQSALFSIVSMVNETNERLLFFETGRGTQLIKHTKSLVLGPEFCLAQDQTLASSFLRALGQAKIRTLCCLGYFVWGDIPEKILNDIYMFVMPHLRTLTFSSVFDIPLTEVVSHCALLWNVELAHFITPFCDVTNLKALPNIRSLALDVWNSSNLAPDSSLGSYLEVKGSLIESFSLGQYHGEDIWTDLIAPLKSSLCQLTIDEMMLLDLARKPPSRFDELPQLKRLYFTISPERFRWPVFLRFLDRHFEQKCFPLSLKDIYVRVVGWYNYRSRSVSPSSRSGPLLRLATNGDVLLHVILQLKDMISRRGGSRKPPTIRDYDKAQRGLESSLSHWVQAGLLIVTRQV